MDNTPCPDQTQGLIVDDETMGFDQVTVGFEPDPDLELAVGLDFDIVFDPDE